MKPSQVQIETQVDVCREVLRRGGHLGIEGASLVALADDVETFKREIVAVARQAADRIAELERAAETSRAEHAEVVAEFAEETLAHELTREAVKAAVDEWNGVSGALGLATAQIRELEGERDELLDFVKSVAAMNYPPDIVPWWTREARAIVARIEKSSKGTT